MVDSDTSADTTPLHGPGSEPVTDTNFGNRLAELRKQRGLTQQSVAAAAGAHVTQIRRYEAGTSQPTLDVLRNDGKPDMYTTAAVSPEYAALAEHGQRADRHRRPTERPQDRRQRPRHRLVPVFGNELSAPRSYF